MCDSKDPLHSDSAYPDWSQTSADYSQFRAGYPDSFFDQLRSYGIGMPGQQILDLGTGTGAVARPLALAGATVIGIDPSPGQIAAAQQLAKSEKLSTERLRFELYPAEAMPTGDGAIDIVCASQCWMYFDEQRVIAETLRTLRPGGHLLICHFHWLLPEEGVAQASEQLLLAHNPCWAGANWSGEFHPMPGWKGLHPVQFWTGDDPTPYTQESWRGRFRACRGVSATLTADQVRLFDREHAALLASRFPTELVVPHRMEIQLFRKAD